MSIYNKFVILATLAFGGGLFSTPIVNSVLNVENTDIQLLIGLRIQFPQSEIDNSTSGDETFFLNEIDENILSRCDGFFVDLPPHNQSYFQSQMNAVNNYFNSVSNGNINFDIEMTENILTANEGMAYYASSDTTLGDLFIEGINGFNSEIESIVLNYFSDIEMGLEQTLIVLFHAGIGQDFAVPFLDPTPNDLSSAYIEETMLRVLPSISEIKIKRGVLLPESQNHIYYNVIESIFNGEEDFCDYQIGMTGIFSFLVGYALGIPPLYNIETGDAGVGVFGLMDHGSNNGRGVIPAPPTAWSRINAGWVEPTLLNKNGIYEIYSRNIEDKIMKIPISNDEYFLLEFRNNLAVESDNLEEIRFQEDFSYLHWFDVLTDSLPELINLTEMGIIESISNYDLGLPETGALIWHIKEPNSSLDSINIDPENRHIHLEEADGAIDIGYESFNPFFNEHITGWGADMWFPRNSQWELANQNFDEIEFSDLTFPNTKTNSGVKTNIRISEINISDSTFNFKFQKTSNLNWLQIAEYGSYPIGATSNSVIMKSGNDFFQIYLSIPDTISINTINIDFTDDCINNPFQIIQPENSGYECITQPQTINGYIENPDFLIEIDNASAVGDIDLDGLDEIFYFENGKLYCENENGTFCNGFPISGNFKESLLIANIIDDEFPEIILKEGYDLKIISHLGIELFSESSLTNEMPIIVPNWDGELAGLVDGTQIFTFEYDEQHSYWITKFGTINGDSQSSGFHFSQEVSFDGIEKKKVYNYPNPVRDGKTTFRFFNYGASSVKITIFNSAGQFIESFEKNDLTYNEYNEYEWETGRLNVGVYLAEIKPNIGNAHLVHVMILNK